MLELPVAFFKFSIDLMKSLLNVLGCFDSDIGKEFFVIRDIFGVERSLSAFLENVFSVLN